MHTAQSRERGGMSAATLSPRPLAQAPLTTLRKNARGIEMTSVNPVCFRVEGSEMTGPRAVEVCIHATSSNMRDWAKVNGFEDIDDDTAAFTQDFDDPEPAPTASMHFAADQMHLSLIVHETVHAVFAIYSQVRRNRITLTAHTEEMPEWIGNISSLVHIGLRGMGYPIDEDDT